MPAAPGGPLLTGHGQPFQEKPETAEYRVVFAPHVAVRDRPWGRIIGKACAGEVLQMTHRAIGVADGPWVKTERTFGGGHADVAVRGWMLVDGQAIHLPALLERVDGLPISGSGIGGRIGSGSIGGGIGSSGGGGGGGGDDGRIVRRYRVVHDRLDVRERPALAGTAVVGKIFKGAIVRTDHEVNGWARLQTDFYVLGSAEPVEGWAPLTGKAMMSVRGALMEPWEAPSAGGPSATVGGVGSARGGLTARYWVLSADGVAVRERPWGRVLATKPRGMLLRCDAERDGWVRVEEDYTEAGPLDSLGGGADGSGGRRVDDDERDDDADGGAALLEGWVLLDGRDLGLPRQLQKRRGEKVPPEEEPRRSEAERRERRARKHAAHAARGEDFSLAAVLREAKVSDEVAAALAASGVECLDGLITLISRGDHHEELRKCGVGKLGVRAKLATLVQPQWKALALKEQGNDAYRSSRFEAAAQLYTQAIELLACPSTDLALNCYANRAACFQQMREPQLALADTEHVLAFDPSNAKALARKQVYEQQLAGM